MSAFKNMKPLLDIKRVCELSRISRSRVYELVKKGEFPQPVQALGFNVGFIEAEIVNFIEQHPDICTRKRTGEVVTRICEHSFIIQHRRYKI